MQSLGLDYAIPTYFCSTAVVGNGGASHYNYSSHYVTVCHHYKGFMVPHTQGATSNGVTPAVDQVDPLLLRGT